MNDEKENIYQFFYFVLHCVTFRPVTLETYSHVVAVDVIWTHNIGITVLQDDPGVIDWRKQVDEVKRRWERGRTRKNLVNVCTIKM